MIIYDCEIIKAIPDKNNPPLENVDYCDGWRDFKNLGISVIGAYDYDTGRHRVFLEDNFDAFQYLVNSTDIVIGFNSLNFDNPLCRANGIDVPDSKSWDILSEMWVAAGLGRQFEYPSHVGFSLSACSQVNFGTDKTGKGELAPVAWQRGFRGSVIDYCLNDIQLTKELVDRVFRDGTVKDPRDGTKTLTLSPPSLLAQDLSFMD